MTKAQRLKGYADEILKTVDIEKIALPKKFNKWLIDEVFADMRFMFMHRIKGVKMGYCTYCNKEMKIEDYLRQNDEYQCPKCHSGVICKDSGRKRNTLTKGVDIAVAQHIRKGGVLVRQYYIKMDFSGNYKNIEPVTHTPYFWGYFEPGCYATFSCGWCWSYQYDYRRSDHIPSNLKMHDDEYFNNNTTVLYGSDELIKGKMKYCSINLYKQSLQKERYNLFRFLQFYCEHPVLTERLLKEGYGGLLVSRLEYNHTGGIDIKKETVRDAFGMNKKEIEMLKELDGGVCLYNIKHFKFLKKHGIKATPENLRYISRAYRMTDVDFCLKYAKFNDIKKVTNHNGNGINQYVDYLNECIELDFDMTCKSVLVPQNLHEAHQRTIELLREKRDKKRAEELKGKQEKFEKKLLPKYNKKYSFEAGDYLIRPAKSATELISEGNALNHCVGRYADSYLTGGLIILLIREKSEPDKPFYTMEISLSGDVIQCRTTCNQSYNENEKVKAFVELWKSRNKKSNNKNKTNVA